MKIATRLMLLCAVLVGLTALMGVGALVQMRSMNRMAEEITDKWMQSVELVNKLRTMASDLRVLDVRHQATLDKQVIAETALLSEDLLSQFNDSYRTYLLLADSAEERQLQQNFDTEWDAYTSMHRLIMAGASSRISDQEKRRFEQASFDLFRRSSNDLRFLSDLSHDSAVAASIRVRERYLESSSTAIYLLVGTILLATLMWFAYLRSIMRPLRQAVAFADRIAAGDIQSQAPPIAKNEIGRLLYAMDIMRIRVARMVSELETLAFYDVLTQLPNRRLLLDRVAQSLKHAQRHQRFGALLFLDLNKFKQLNDTHGHEAGDMLLVEVAARLMLGLRQEDTVARLGGDEFVVLLQDVGTTEPEARAASAHMAEKLGARLCEEYVLGAIRHTGSASVGVTVFDGNEADPEQLLSRADAAMYEVKRGRDVFAAQPR